MRRDATHGPALAGSGRAASWSPAAPASSAVPSLPALLDAGHEVRVLDALLPEVHPGGWPAPPRPARRARPRRRPRPAGRRRSTASTRSATRPRSSASGSTCRTCRCTSSVNELGTAVLLAAMDRAGVRTAGAGQLDGGVRRGPLPLRRARRRPAAAARRGRPRGRPLGAAVPGLRPATWRGAPCPRTRRSTRAASTPRPRPRRSTSPPSWARGERRHAPSRCATTTCTARTCPGTRRTPGWPACSAAPSARGRGAAGVRGRRPAARLRARARRRAGQPARARAPSPVAGTLRAYNVASGTPHTIGDVAAGDRRRRAPAAGGDRAVPARRRAARRRLAGARPRRARVHRAGRLRGRDARVRHGPAAATRPCPTWPVPDVVLPCLDEAGALPWVLDRLPAGYRAVVADNGSTDGSADVARAHGALVVQASPARLRRRLPRRAARHRAADDVVCFLDADGSLDPQRAAAGRRPGARAARPTSCSAAAAPRPGAPGRRTPGWATSPSRGRCAGARRTTCTTSGPMRACRRDALLGAGPARPALRLPAGDGAGGRGRRLAGARGRRRLRPADRPVQGHRHGRRDRPGRARHAARAPRGRSGPAAADRRRARRWRRTAHR